MKENDYLIIDFDSTFVKVEALEEIAKEALRENPNRNEIQKKIEDITEKGMRGEISFSESLKNRLNLFSATRGDIEKVSKIIEKNITDSFLKNKEFIKNNSERIFIISGGFKECIFVVSDQFDIPRENVLANEFIFDEKGNIVGIDEDNLACQSQGKVRQTKGLKIDGRVFALGDGWTDFEIKREGAADFFLAFAENISRPSVVELADAEVESFDEVIDFIQNKG